MTTLHLRYERREGSWADYGTPGSRKEFASLTAARWVAQTLLEDYQTATVRIVSEETTVVEEWCVRPAIR